MTMSSDIIGIASLDLQGIAVLLGGVSAYCIWRQLTALALAGQANVSERLASQSIEILFVTHHRDWYADVFVKFVDAGQRS
jgi:hypothetical protein